MRELESRLEPSFYGYEKFIPGGKTDILTVPEKVCFRNGSGQLESTQDYFHIRLTPVADLLASAYIVHANPCERS